MKKSAKLKRKTIKMIVKNLIVLVVLASIAFASVQSWFKDDPEASASGISASVVVDDSLEFFIVAPNSADQYANGAIDNWIASYNNNHKNEQGFVPKGWHKGAFDLDFSDPELKFMEDLFLCDVTGDGMTFCIPELMQYDEVTYVITNQLPEEAVANENYMSFDIYFRCLAGGNVMLKHDSSIAPVGTIDPTTDEGKKPAAVGAVRLAAINGNERELLWIPAPNLWYDGVNDVLHTNVDPTAGNHGSAYYDGSSFAIRNEKTSDHAYYYASNSGAARQVLTGSAVTASTTNIYHLPEDTFMCELTAPTGSDTYYHGHVRINLWIEGEDAEARLAMVEGRFRMALGFDIQESASTGS